MATGAFESITIEGRRFACKSDDSPKVKYKGKKTETIMKGDGSFSAKQEWTAGYIKDINVEILDDRDDLKYLQNLQDKGIAVSITATKCNGDVLSGSVLIVDEVEKDEGEGFAPLNLEGDVELL